MSVKHKQVRYWLLTNSKVNQSANISCEYIFYYKEALCKELVSSNTQDL